MLALPGLGAERGLEPLSLRDLGLGDDLLLEDHGRLDHEELLALVCRSGVAVRGAPSGLDVADGALEDFPLVLLLLFLLLAVGGLEVEAGLALDDETGSEGQLARGGFVALITLVPTALFCLKGQGSRHEATTLLHKVVNLLVDLLIPLQQLTHQLFFMLLLLHLIIDVILQKLLLVEL